MPALWNGLLLDAVEADVDGAEQIYPGGEGLLTVECANFGGGAVSIEARGFAGTWLNQPDPDGNTSFSTNTSFRFSSPPGVAIRARLVGATDPDPCTVNIAK